MSPTAWRGNASRCGLDAVFVRPPHGGQLARLGRLFKAVHLCAFEKPLLHSCYNALPA